MTLFPRTILLALLLTLGVTAHAAGLNDTGQTLCYDAAGATISCAGSGQDGQYGRDPAYAASQFAKTGAGNAGFDFTKIANNGTTLAAGAVLGAAATDWACTQDNVTGLTWEVKTTSGLRSNAHTYTWYSANTASNGGNAGNLGTNTCDSTLSAYSNQCNTANYIAAVNAGAGLCGHTDWRLPSLKELESLVDFSVSAAGVAPTIDATYFPNTQIGWFWSANNLSSSPANAWFVSFSQGHTFISGKSNDSNVRLVRGGQ